MSDEERATTLAWNLLGEAMTEREVTMTRAALAAVRADERRAIARWLREHGRPTLADLIESGEHGAGR